MSIVRSLVEFRTGDVGFRTFTDLRERSFSFIAQHEYDVHGLAHEAPNALFAYERDPHLDEGPQQLEYRRANEKFIEEWGSHFIEGSIVETLGEGCPNTPVNMLSSKQTLELASALAWRIHSDAGQFCSPLATDGTEALAPSLPRPRLLGRLLANIFPERARIQETDRFGSIIENYVRFTTEKLIALHRTQYRALYNGEREDDLRGLRTCREAGHAFMGDLLGISPGLVEVAKRTATRLSATRPIELVGLPESLFEPPTAAPDHRRSH